MRVRALRLLPWALMALVVVGATVAVFYPVPYWLVPLVLFTAATAIYVYAWLGIRGLVRRARQAYRVRYWRHWQMARQIVELLRELRRRRMHGQDRQRWP